MALVTRMASDISGKEADEADFVQLVIRSHKSLDEPRVLDVLPDEIKALKAAGDVVTCEVGTNGDKVTLVVTLAEFRKVVPDNVAKKGRKTRGRRPGFSPAKSE